MALDDNNYAFVAYFDVFKAFDTVWVNGLFYKMYEMGIRGKTWRLLYRSYIDFMCKVRSKVRIRDMSSEWYKMMCGIHQGGFLSLINYMAFINQMIINLRDSDLCCRIDALLSTPPINTIIILTKKIIYNSMKKEQKPHLECQK